MVSKKPTTGTVDFELYMNPSAFTTATEVFAGLFDSQRTASNPGFHTLGAALTDSGGAVDSDTHDHTATERDCYESIGNSIFWGMKGFFSDDGKTQDDSVGMLQGVRFNLEDELNHSAFAPGNNMVFKEAVPGDTSCIVLDNRLAAILERHSNANFAILLVGINDTGGSPVQANEDYLSFSIGKTSSVYVAYDAGALCRINQHTGHLQVVNKKGCWLQTVAEAKFKLEAYASIPRI